MSLFIQKNFFYYVPKGKPKFYVIITRIKDLLPVNLTILSKDLVFIKSNIELLLQIIFL